MIKHEKTKNHENHVKMQIDMKEEHETNARDNHDKEQTNKGNLLIHTYKKYQSQGYIICTYITKWWSII